MSLRVTQSAATRNALASISRSATMYDGILEKLSSMREVNRPSDAPAQAAKAVGLRTHISQLEHAESVIAEAQSFLGHASSVIQDTSSLFAQMRELAIAGSDPTLTETDRRAMAEEADSLLQALIDVGNTQHGDRYIFAGTGTDTPPFEGLVGADGKIHAVRYNGDAQPLDVEVKPGVTFRLADPGNTIFQQRERGATTFQGSTGAVPGAGADTDVGFRKLEVFHTGTSGYATTGAASGASPDTFVGDVVLTVAHTATRYATSNTTGLRAGTGSASDTIVGEHTLTVDTAANTISLNGGPAIAIAGTDNQAVSDGTHTVYVDTTGPLSTGSVTIVGEGTLNAGGRDVAIDFTQDQEVGTANGASIRVDTRAVNIIGAENLTVSAAMTIDGGATSIPVTFQADQTVTSSLTGAVTHVDTTGVGSAGAEVVEYTGTCDIFETLICLRDALRDGFGQDEPDQLSLLGQTLERINGAHDQVLMTAAQLGSRVRRIESTQNQISALRLTATESLSQTEDADVSELVVEMKAQENAFQAALAASARMNQLSLLDYWR